MQQSFGVSEVSHHAQIPEFEGRGIVEGLDARVEAFGEPSGLLVGYLRCRREDVIAEGGVVAQGKHVGEKGAGCVYVVVVGLGRERLGELEAESGVD